MFTMGTIIVATKINKFFIFIILLIYNDFNTKTSSLRVSTNK